MGNTVNIYVNKTDLGLNNVDNTSDLDKPISTATQNYVDTAVSNASTPDATTLVKGKVRLAGDLAGTANSPTVPGLADRETIYSAQSPDLNFRFNKKTIHGVTGGGSYLNPLTGNIGVYIEAQMHINVTSVMLHNDSVAPTFSSEFTKSADSLPYITGQDNYIYATLVNLDPVCIIYTIKRGGTNIYGTFLTTDLKGANNGVAELDSNGKVPSAQLPSFVDDVEEYADLAGFPVTGESGKIYIALNTNLTYRWGGSTYVEISPSLALGETSASAYRGDRGKIAYDHSLLTSGNPHNVTKTDVGLSNVVNSDTTTTANITDSSNKRFVTDAQLTVIGNTSGTNTGDETQSTIKTKLGAATTSVDGYLTSTDWNTFNGKQNALGFTAENVANKDTDGTLAANSDTKYASQKATKTYIDTQVATKSDKNITLDRKTASYTLVVGDNGKLIEMNVASANTLTIDASIFSAGNQILISQYGAGQTTITAGAGVTLRSSGGKLKTSAQYALVTIIAISSTEFYVAGDLTA